VTATPGNLQARCAIGHVLLQGRLHCGSHRRLTDYYPDNPTAIIWLASCRVLVGVIVIRYLQRTLVDQSSEPGVNDTGSHRAARLHREIERLSCSRRLAVTRRERTTGYRWRAMNVNPIAVCRHVDDVTCDHCLTGLRGWAPRKQRHRANQNQNTDRNRLHACYS